MTPVFFRKKKKEEAIHVSDYDTESRQVESRPDGIERKKEKEGRLVLRLPSSGWLQLPYILLSFPNHSYLRKEGRSGGGWLEVEIEDAYNLDGPGIPTPPSLSLSFLPEREPRALSTRTCTRDGHFGKRKKKIQLPSFFEKKSHQGMWKSFPLKRPYFFLSKIYPTHTHESKMGGATPSQFGYC